MALYKLTDEQVSSMLNLLQNMQFQGNRADLKVSIAKIDEIIEALKKPIQEK